jgi:hypothetical protein
VTDYESEVGGAPQNALEIGEAPAGAPFPVPDLEVVRDAAQHHARNRWRVDDLQFQWHGAMQPPFHPWNQGPCGRSRFHETKLEPPLRITVSFGYRGEG